MEADKGIIEATLVHTLLRVAHNLHLIYLTETVEVAHILTAVVACQARQYLVGGDTRALALDGIHIHFPLRGVEVERGERHAYLFALVKGSNELLRIGI